MTQKKSSATEANDRIYKKEFILVTISYDTLHGLWHGLPVDASLPGTASSLCLGLPVSLLVSELCRLYRCYRFHLCGCVEIDQDR